VHGASLCNALGPAVRIASLMAQRPRMCVRKIKRQTRSDRRNTNELPHRLRPNPEIQLPRMNKDLAKLPVPIKVSARGQEIHELAGERLFAHYTAPLAVHSRLINRP
jgi:hypothetical protein